MTSLENTSSALANQNIGISVIIPLQDHRGLGFQAIDSWLSQQACQADDFEIIVIIDQSTKRSHGSIHQYLRSHDQFIEVESNNVFEQYDIGARKAKNKILLFTEPHCLAEPLVIQQLLAKHLKYPFTSYCLKTIPICRSRLAKTAHHLHEEFISNCIASSQGIQIIIRGFSTNKDIYLALGGFDYHYSYFSEQILSQKMRQNNHKIEYASEIGIQHLYEATFRDWNHAIQSFAAGEAHYHQDCWVTNSTPLLKTPNEIRKAQYFSRVRSQLILQISLQHLFTFQGMSKTRLGWWIILKYTLQQVMLTTLGTAALQFPNYAKIWYNKLIFFLSWLSQNRQQSIFREYFMTSLQKYRLQYVLDHPSPLASYSRENQYLYIMSDLDRYEYHGFHALESYSKQVFRWTEAIALLKLDIPPEDYHVEIQLLPVRVVTPHQELSIYFNSSPVQFLEFNRINHQLKFKIKKSIFSQTAESHLVLLCYPWFEDVENEPSRQLGLPIVSLELKPQK